MLDDTDRRLIAALKRDGRASVTALAGEVGLSRATVQGRIDRLLARGTIRRFTVDLGPVGEADLTRAVMMIELQGKLARAIVSRLRAIPEIASLHTTNGAWDLVATIETRTLPEFDRVLREVREIPGVLNSETCLLLDEA